MFMPVVSRTQSILRIVDMDYFQVFESDLLVKQCHRLRDRLFYMEVIARCIRVTGVKADPDTIFLFYRIADLSDFFKLRAHTVFRPGHVLEADLEVSLRPFGRLVESIADTLQSYLSPST